MADNDDASTEGDDNVEDESTDAGTDAGNGEADNGGDSSRGLSDDQAAKLRRSVTSNTRRRLLEDAGVESVDELKELVTEARERREQNLTEAERAKKALEDEREAAAKERAEMVTQRVTFGLKEALRADDGDNGSIRLDRVDDAVGFLLRDVLADEGDEEEAIAAAVAEARERWPEWFENVEGEDDAKGPSAAARRRVGEGRRKSQTAGPRDRARTGYEALTSRRSINRS